MNRYVRREGGGVAGRSHNDQSNVTGGFWGAFFRLATPTPGNSKYVDKQLFHGRVNPVNVVK